MDPHWRKGGVLLFVRTTPLPMQKRRKSYSFVSPKYVWIMLDAQFSNWRSRLRKSSSWFPGLGLPWKPDPQRQKLSRLVRSRCGKGLHNCLKIGQITSTGWNRKRRDETNAFNRCPDCGSHQVNSTPLLHHTGNTAKIKRKRVVNVPCLVSELSCECWRT